MLGLEIVPDRSNGDIVNRLMEDGLLTVPAADNVVRILPPLIIGDTEIHEAVSTMDKVFGDLTTKTVCAEAAAL